MTIPHLRECTANPLNCIDIDALSAPDGVTPEEFQRFQSALEGAQTEYDQYDYTDRLVPVEVTRVKVHQKVKEIQQPILEDMLQSLETEIRDESGKQLKARGVGHLQYNEATTDTRFDPVDTGSLDLQETKEGDLSLHHSLGADGIKECIVNPFSCLSKDTVDNVLEESITSNEDARAEIHDVLFDGIERFNKARLQPNSLEARHAISDDITVQLADVAKIHGIEDEPLRRLSSRISEAAERHASGRTSW